MRTPLVKALAVAALAACGDGGAAFDYPLDGTLRLNQLQNKGSHNSYHLVSLPDNPAYAYSHKPLDEQLATQGVRNFELDLYFFDSGAEPSYFEVHHLPIDWKTTCDRLATCLGLVARWSAAHPAHEPLFILLEPKDPYGEARAAAYFDVLEATLLGAFPRARVLTPARVRGDAASLREAVTGRGWPTLGELRGQVLFVLLDSGEHRAAYRKRNDPLIFTLGGADDPEGGILNVDDAVTDGGAIHAAVAQGFLVRTRADIDGVEARAGDRTRLERALASGAQFISTDYPAAVPGVSYVVDIPGGKPARCNPVNAPAGCAAEDIEDPAFVE